MLSLLVRLQTTLLNGQETSGQTYLPRPILPLLLQPRQHWFTYQQPDPSRAYNRIETSEVMGSVQLDDNYRNCLHDKLYQRPPEHALPSTEFLVCSLPGIELIESST